MTAKDRRGRDYRRATHGYENWNLRLTQEWQFDQSPRTARTPVVRASHHPSRGCLVSRGLATRLARPRPLPADSHVTAFAYQTRSPNTSERAILHRVRTDPVARRTARLLRRDTASLWGRRHRAGRARHSCTCLHQRYASQHGSWPWRERGSRPSRASRG